MLYIWELLSLFVLRDAFTPLVVCAIRMCALLYRKEADNLFQIEC